MACTLQLLSRGILTWLGLLVNICSIETDALQFQYSGEQLSTARRVVWVTGYPRSSTSTVLSMVSGGDTESANVFSLFEPCHPWDEYTQELKDKGCGGVLRSISHCNFTGIEKIWGWADPHTSSRGSTFNSSIAANICGAADLVAFKTVGSATFDHRLTKWVELLNDVPEMQVLNVVRDPRGIFASWKQTPEFSFLEKDYGLKVYMDICDAFAANLDFTHPRVHTVVMEDLVRNHVHTTKSAYDFLGLSFNDHVKHWLNRTFDADDCPPTPEWQENFTDCHSNSSSHAEAWRQVLTREEIHAFHASPACRRVAEAYGYPEVVGSV